MSNQDKNAINMRDANEPRRRHRESGENIKEKWNEMLPTLSPIINWTAIWIKANVIEMSNQNKNAI